MTTLADMALVWSGHGDADMAIVDDDVAFDDGLDTAVLLSLFTDRRAEDDDALPSDDGDKRGWWADEFSDVEGDEIGSRLWLLDRSAMRVDLVKRAEELIRESLAWALEDLVAERIDVEVETGKDRLLFAVTLHRPAADPLSFRFSHVWGAIAEGVSQ